MEALSPTMEEGRLVTWVKNEGDPVASGDVLAEVETDQAVMELVARGDGVLRRRLINEGDAVPVGQLIGVVAAADENVDALVAGGGSGTAAAAPAAPPAPVGNTAQAPGTPPSPAAPAPTAAQAPPAPPPSTAAAPQTPPAAAPPAAAPSDDPAAGAANGSGAPGERARSSPLARRLASARGLDLGAVHGSGPGGRIVKRDIEAAAAQPAAAPRAAAAGTPAAAPPPPRISGDGDFQDVPLTQIRKTIARRLAESIGPVPTFYLTAEYDMERVADLRTAMAELGDGF
jgi:pyruvate dehydrogenase E2 component (dihydrolipoamide acetyltransferase)